MTAEFTDDGYVIVNIDGLIEELNRRDAEADGRAVMTTDDVRRALFGIRLARHP